MRTHIAIALAVLFTAGLIASCAPTRVEMDYGTSHKLQMVNQIANPEAGKDVKPVEGMDGQTSSVVMTKHRKEFEKQEKQQAPIFNITAPSK